MIRIGTQLTFCTPEKILRRTAVELDEQNVITHLYNLDDGNVEPSQTLFFDGILSAGIVSVKQHAGMEETSHLLQDYQYLDVFGQIPSTVIKQTGKPLILDFGAKLPNEINVLIPFLASALPEFSIFDIIAACTYYPSLILGWAAGLTENTRSKLILWENVDLIEKKLTFNTFIREIN